MSGRFVRTVRSLRGSGERWAGQRLLPGASRSSRGPPRGPGPAIALLWLPRPGVFWLGNWGSLFRVDFLVKQSGTLARKASLCYWSCCFPSCWPLVASPPGWVLSADGEGSGLPCASVGFCSGGFAQKSELVWNIYRSKTRWGTLN